MITKIVFPKEYTLELPHVSSLEKVGENLSLDFFSMKEDPMYGIDSTVWRKINTKYMYFQEKEQIFFYYSRAFIEARYSGKPIFPYFKGIIEKIGDQTIVRGRLKYHRVISFFLPVLFLGMISLVFILKLSLSFLIAPALLALITLISAKNIEKELISDLELMFKKINVKNSTSANA